MQADTVEPETYDSIVQSLGGQSYWVDPKFPHTMKSINAEFSETESKYGHIEWKRIEEIFKPNPPSFVDDGHHRDDIIQGKLGDCWFVSTCSSLAHNSQLFEQVVPNHKEQNEKLKDQANYKGIFHFRFHVWNEWKDIFVDDFLPTVDGKLIFVRSRTRNEFWPMLLEKAFAKLYGDYEKLTLGGVAEAFYDVTGGVPQNFNLKRQILLECCAACCMDTPAEPKELIFEDLRKWSENKDIICAGKNMDFWDDRRELQTKFGLIKNHAYCVTDVKKLPVKAEQLYNPEVAKLFKKTAGEMFLIRMRNPWGTREWTGPMSDSSPQWNLLTKEQRENLGMVVADDGEFWMPFSDFMYQFHSVGVCHLYDTTEGAANRYYSSVQIHNWMFDPDPEKNRAGGGIQHGRNTWYQNPQFRFDVPPSVETVELSLIRDTWRSDERLKKHRDSILMDMAVFRADPSFDLRWQSSELPLLISASDPDRFRSRYLKLENLPAGRYIVVPTNSKPGLTMKFMLRLFSKSQIDLALIP